MAADRLAGNGLRCETGIIFVGSLCARGSSGDDIWKSCFLRRCLVRRKCLWLCVWGAGVSHISSAPHPFSALHFLCWRPRGACSLSVDRRGEGYQEWMSKQSAGGLPIARVRVCTYFENHGCRGLLVLPYEGVGGGAKERGISTSAASLFPFVVEAPHPSHPTPCASSSVPPMFKFATPVPLPSGPDLSWSPLSR